MPRSPPWDRAEAALLALVTAAAVGHTAALSRWYVDDAAITFAYADHVAAGLGPVPYAGGEVVEGWSNPAWLATLVVLRWLGFDLLVATHLLALALTAITVPVVARLTRDLVGPRSPAPLVAAASLAASSPFAVWNISGLENPLLNLLLATAGWRAVAEARGGGPPWSAALAFVVACTRPEGVVYAALLGACVAGAHLRSGRGPGAVAAWGAAFLVPWGAYQAWHLATFAWPFPNTYYAKVDGPVEGRGWTDGGWRYVRRFFRELGQGAFLPVYLAGAFGPGRWRSVAAGTVAVGGWVLAAGLPAVGALTPWALAVFAVAVAVVAARSSSGGARAGAWLAVWATVGFAVLARGDWMPGYRWFATATVPAAVLFGLGADALARVVDARRAGAGLALAAALTLAQVPPNVVHTLARAEKSGATPWGVKVRADWVAGLRDRIHHEGRFVDLDSDMGGHLYWSDFEMVDAAGLVDVPFAHHGWPPAFVRDYVFRERRPDFVHLHGPFVGLLGLSSLEEWREYVPIPGYPTDERGANLLRRETLLGRWDGADPPVDLERGVRVRGPRVVAAPGAGGAFEVEVGLEGGGEDFRVLLLATDGRKVRSWELPPGYDWLPPSAWREGEVFAGRFTLSLGPELGEGTYDLGLVVLGADGAVLGPPGATGPTPALAAGEVRFPGALVVLSTEAADAARAAERDRAREEAEVGRCAAAERSWRRARAHRAGEVVDPGEAATMAGALASCWARSADRGPREERVRRVTRALDLDSTVQELAVAAPLAEELWAEGMAARAGGDAEGAFRAFSDCVAVDPTRTWARRYAEEARAIRLGLPPP